MYRARRRHCPACATPMDEVPIPDDPSDPTSRVEVDRCSGCGGTFLEFFDGEPLALSRTLPRSVPGARGTAPRAGGPLTCPDCQEPMAPRPYLGQGPEIPRCETCLAVFLTPGLRDAMARTRLAPAEESEEPSWVERLVSWFRS